MHEHNPFDRLMVLFRTSQVIKYLLICRFVALYSFYFTVYHFVSQFIFSFLSCEPSCSTYI